MVHSPSHEPGLQKDNQKNVFPLADARQFERDGFTGKVLVEKTENRGFTTLVISVHGNHPKKRMLGDTTRTYFVMSGSGRFIIDGTETLAEPGVLFIIEPGHTYEYEGNMKLLETNISPSNTFEDELVSD